MDISTIAIVAIIVWGIVSIVKARHGIISDEDGNETFVKHDDTQAQLQSEETRREMDELRDRLQVLERIVTDNNTLDARKRAQISAEIEALRGTSEEKSSGVPLPKELTATKD